MSVWHKSETIFSAEPLGTWVLQGRTKVRAGLRETVEGGWDHLISMMRRNTTQSSIHLNKQISPHRTYLLLGCRQEYDFCMKQ